MEEVSFVHLPLLKILHLYHVTFINDQDCLHLFSNCPNLEDLEIKLTTGMTEKFNRLSKLIRANINVELFPLEIVRNVEVLLLDWVMTIRFYSFPLLKKKKMFFDVMILSYCFVSLANISRPEF